MHALALLGPNADERDIMEFASSARVAIPIATAIETDHLPDAALIFGGDGTVHRYLPSLVATGVPTLVVPMGSGNDFARALSLKNRARALAVWRRFCDSRQNVLSIDAGEVIPTKNGKRATSNLFCCVAGAGIDSEVNRRANALPRWLRAHGGYALSLVPVAATFGSRRIMVEFEDENGATGEISDQALMCAFANARAYGHGMRIAPDASLDDGLLDLVYVRKASAARLLKLFPTIYFGAHLRAPEVIHHRVRRLNIASDPPLDIFGDGEFICRTPADITVRPGALRVIC